MDRWYYVIVMRHTHDITSSETVVTASVRHRSSTCPHLSLHLRHLPHILTLPFPTEYQLRGTAMSRHRNVRNLDIDGACELMLYMKDGWSARSLFPLLKSRMKGLHSSVFFPISPSFSSHWVSAAPQRTGHLCYYDPFTP